MPNTPTKGSRHPPHLPSLLTHLRTSSSASVPSVSLSTLTPELTAQPDRVKPNFLSARSPSQLSLRSTTSSSSKTARQRTVSTPPLVSRQSARRTPLRTASSSSDLRSEIDDASSVGRETLSRASSSSSLDGLASRLQGARQGRGRGAVLPSEEAGASSTDKGKERAVEQVGEERGVVDDPASSSTPPPASRNRQESYTLSSTVTSSLSPSTTDDNDVAPLAAHEDENDGASSDDDDDASIAFDIPSRFEGQPDPRDMLRAQLARPSPSSPTSPSRSTSRHRLSRANSAASPDENGDSEKARDGFGVVRYQPRRYFILSTAGKLVWTSDSDEEQAAGLVGVMQAIVSIFADEGDKIRYVNAGKTRIAFLLKAPLYLVVVSNGWGEPESVLRSHLDHLYLQVLSAVTLSQLQALFSRRSNADLRQTISGTETFFSSLTASLQTSPLSLSVLTSSIEVYRLATSVREEAAKSLEVGKEVIRDLDLLYILVVAHGRLVTLLRPKKHSIHPTDLHLLLSTIYSTTPAPPLPPASPTPSPSLSATGVSLSSPPKPKPRKAPLTDPSAESWFPICLPRFNPRGFLYAYVSFLPTAASSAAATSSDGTADEEGGVGVVVLSSRREAFDGVKEAAAGVKDRLLAQRGGKSGGLGGMRAAMKLGSNGGVSKGDGGLVHEMEMERVGQEYFLGELAIPGLRHFFYKSRPLVQVTRPAWEGEYKEENSEGRCRLITLYQTVHEALHPRAAQAGSAAKAPAQVQYVRTEHEAVLGWITPAFELYVCTSPLLPHSAVVSAARAVSKWVQKEEARLFLMSAPSF